MTGDFVLYTDGAARGNPGPSASGYILMSGGKKVSSAFAYNGKRTNNYAEYTAIIMGLEWCAANLDDTESVQLKVRSDSELVVRQLGGRYKVKALGLKELNRKAITLAAKFKGVQFESRPRENRGISAVDAELNRLLDTVCEGKDK